MRLAPLSPLRMRFQVGSTPLASGETMPKPVTTPRLIIRTPPSCRRRYNSKTAGRVITTRRMQSYRPLKSAFRVLLKKLGGIANGENRFRGVVRNLATEFLFKRHHEFDRIKAVRTEIVDEACVSHDLLGLDTKVPDHDLLTSLANLTHRSTSCCSIKLDRKTIRA